MGITRAHLEEDAGKLVHQGAASLAGSTHSLADYNRAGTPLMEIVSEPDLRTGREAAAYGAEVRRLVRFLGVSDGNMAEGSLRCDVNISIRRKGDEKFGTKARGEPRAGSVKHHTNATDARPQSCPAVCPCAASACFSASRRGLCV